MKDPTPTPAPPTEPPRTASTTEDFENAPVGATATYPDGSKAVKMGDDEWGWVTPARFYYDNEGMAYWNYTLDPIEPAPTTAREALDLAWELAHPVKEGQIIPKGTRYLTFFTSGVREYTARDDFKPDLGHASKFRTLEPLPEPEPDWLDAPAVIATTHWAPELQEVWFPQTRGYWKCPCCGDERHWSDLRDVTPLYLEGEKA